MNKVREGQELIDSFLKEFRVRLEDAYDAISNNLELAINDTINELKDNYGLDNYSHDVFYCDECEVIVWCNRAGRGNGNDDE